MFIKIKILNYYFKDFHFQENKSNETNIIQQVPLPQTADSFYNNNNNSNPSIYIYINDFNK